MTFSTTVKHKVCHRLKDLKPISEIYGFKVVKLWSVKDGDFVDQGRSFNHRSA